MQANEFPRPDPQDWRERAECRNHPEVNWTPDVRDGKYARRAVEAAAPLCATCPVRNECIEAARHTPPEDSGIYAGRLSRDWKRERPLPPNRTIDHGTPRGYRQHQRHGVPMCARCHFAYRTYDNHKKREPR
jgi:hypothetical protein